MTKQIWQILDKAMECLENTEPPDNLLEETNEQEAIIATRKWLDANRP